MVKYDSSGEAICKYYIKPVQSIETRFMDSLAYNYEAHDFGKMLLYACFDHWAS